MPLSISPVPIQVQGSTNQGQEQSQEIARQILPERSMKLWQFVLYRLGVRLVRTGYRLQSFAEDKHATTD